MHSIHRCGVSCLGDGSRLHPRSIDISPPGSSTSPRFSHWSERQDDSLQMSHALAACSLCARPTAGREHAGATGHQRKRSASRLVAPNQQRPSQLRSRGFFHRLSKSLKEQLWNGARFVGPCSTPGCGSVSIEFYSRIVLLRWLPPEALRRPMANFKLTLLST